MNKVILCGRVGKNPELKKFETSQSASFSLATNYKYKNKKGDYEEKVCWHLIEAWGKTADIVCGYITKGSKILIEGQIDNQQYEKNGEKRTISKIKLLNFEFCDKKQESTSTVEDNNFTVPF